MDREAWRAAVHGVSKSWTRLSDLIEPTECNYIPYTVVGSKVTTVNNTLVKLLIIKYRIQFIYV